MTPTALLVAAATPTPAPDAGSPGVVGFVAIFVVAILTVLIVLDMNRRVRRTRYRAEVAALLDAEEEARRGEDG